MKTTEIKSIGEELAAARKEKGWSIEQAAHETRLQREVIAKIEADRFDLLPSHAYARGFVRIYARELGLDALGMIKKFDGSVEEEEISEIRPETLELVPDRVNVGEEHARKIGLIIVFATVAAASLLGVMQMYRIWPKLFPPKIEHEIVAPAQPTSEETPVKAGEPVVKKAEVTEVAPVVKKAEPAQEIAVAKAEPVNSVPAAPANRLQLKADQDCWVKVVAVNNDQETVLFEDIIPAGSTFPPTIDEAWGASYFKLTLRDAALIDIILNNQNFGKYDKPGRQEFRLPAQ